MRKRWTRALASVAMSAACLLVTSVLIARPAAAHGAFLQPGSRTFLCWEDGITASGQIVPKNPACSAAVAQSGTNALYNWFAVLRRAASVSPARGTAP